MALTGQLRAAGVDAVHLESDGFHHARDIRYRQGRDSARGYYEDAYDFNTLAERVLRPLGPGGSFTYLTKAHDLATDELVAGETATAGPGSIVVFDCTFIQRGGLRDLWDEVIFLRVDREIALSRGIGRDAPSLNGVQAARAAFEHRYMAACDIYVVEERPAERASVVIDNDDVQAPRIIRAI